MSGRMDPPRRPRVLVVEDDAALRVAMQRLLRDLCEVTAVGELSEGIERAAEPFDLIISDYAMPGGTGLELVHSLRTRNLPTPVMLVTAFVDKEDIDEALAAGMLCGVVHKPWTIADFLSGVRRALGIHLS